MTTIEWRDEVCPSHRCTVCNAMWRYWPEHDTGRPDSWSLRSNACGPCCDNVPMEKQIVFVTVGDIEKWLVSKWAVEAMTQHVFGPNDGDAVQ